MVVPRWLIFVGRFLVKADDTTARTDGGLFRRPALTGETAVSHLRPRDEGEMARDRMVAGWGDPLFLADWDRALFLHFEVDAEALQAVLPYKLDLWEGQTAIVTLVAFTMRRMRPRIGGAMSEWMSAPLATHEFLNARTYVRHGDERGIFFIREWLPNLLAWCVGPATFGLPYRLGRIDYWHDHEAGELAGEVCPRVGNGRLSYRGSAKPVEERKPELRGFLLERYTAFTSAFGLRRKFRVWHGPWNASAVEVIADDASILGLVPGCDEARARFVGAHYSAGVTDVWMGRPRLA